MSSGLSEVLAGVRGGRSWAQDVVDLAGDVALEATDDLGLGLALGESAGHVSLGRLVPAQSDHDDAVQGCVGLAITTAVEPVALSLARGCGDGVRSAERGEGGLGPEPVRVVSGGEEEPRRAVGADAEDLEQRGCGDGGEETNLFLKAFDLDAKFQVA